MESALDSRLLRAGFRPAGEEDVGLRRVEVGFEEVGIEDGVECVVELGVGCVGVEDGFEYVGVEDGFEYVGVEDGFEYAGVEDGLGDIGSEDSFECVGAEDADFELDGVDDAAIFDASTVFNLDGVHAGFEDGLDEVGSAGRGDFGAGALGFTAIGVVRVSSNECVAGRTGAWRTGIGFVVVALNAMEGEGSPTTGFFSWIAVGCEGLTETNFLLTVDAIDSGIREDGPLFGTAVGVTDGGGVDGRSFEGIGLADDALCGVPREIEERFVGETFG